MVCASSPSTATASIAGGFVLVPVASLMAAWRACQRPGLGIGSFRAWLAAREMVARRRSVGEGRAPAYGFPELARLIGVTPKRARVLVARLGAAGLVAWSEASVTFDVPQDHDDPGELADTIGGGKGSVLIPRRLLRFLVDGAKPATIAAALAVLLRCLSRRRSGFDGRGRVKASWIAHVFAVDLRRVKAGRAELAALGWIAPEPSDAWAERRWGRAWRIDLGWARPGASLPPLRRAVGAGLPPVESNPDPLPGGEIHQDLASGGRTGVEVGGKKCGGSVRDPDPTLAISPALTSKPAPPAPRPGPGPGPGPLPPPTLADVRPEDLAETIRTLALFDQAVARKLVGPSEADRLRFLAAAEHARAEGKVNAPGLFAHLVRRGLWSYATQADEDAAARKLKDHLRGDPGITPAGARLRPPPRHPGLGGPMDGPRSLGEAMSWIAGLAARAGGVG